MAKYRQQVEVPFLEGEPPEKSPSLCAAWLVKRENNSYLQNQMARGSLTVVTVAQRDLGPGPGVG